MAETWRQRLAYYFAREQERCIPRLPEVELPTLLIRYDIEPCPAPRMTKFDGIRIAEWRADPKKKLAGRLLRYVTFQDAIGMAVLECVQHDVFHLQDLLCHVGLRFYVPLPPSWSKKKQREHYGRPHESKPDNDNFLKAFYDSLFEQDSRAWDARSQKRWADEAGARVEIWRLPPWNT